jgi:hypothetical protein
VAQHVVDVAGIALVAADLGHEQGVVGTAVLLQRLPDIGALAHVDVGRDGVDRRRGGLPDVQHVPGRPARRIGERVLVVEGIAQGGVDVHRQRQLALAGRGDLVDEPADRPGMEELVGVLAEHLAPGSRLLAHGLDQRAGTGPSNSFWAVGE